MEYGTLSIRKSEVLDPNLDHDLKLYKIILKIFGKLLTMTLENPFSTGTGLI
jgi:hypothetical protein